jgi:trans-aconitate methyltransferase
MEITEAKALLDPAFKAMTVDVRWADLGCGQGTFTVALAYLLGQGSAIYAFDKDYQQIRRDAVPSVDIQFTKLDFVQETLPVTNLDGILMANSLHYVKDKMPFVERVLNHLKSKGQIILVEYDMERQNEWVPYPISFESLKKTFSSHFTHIRKLGERNSIYRKGKLYSCVMKRD